MQEKTNTTDKNNSNSLTINEKIDYPSVRVINQTGEQLGIFSSKIALRLARDNDLDLVLVNGKSNPPVCKILNYGKYKFTQEKKARKARKKQQSLSVKEVKMRYKIEEHDYKVRINQILRFLETGNKVKATIVFRGREVQHLHLAMSLLNRVANDLRSIAEVQQKPYREGKNLIMFLSAKKHLV